MQATVTTWTPSHSDITRAQRKATEVLQSVATPDAIFTASQAMLDAGSDHAAGYRAYYLSLLDSEAWAGALAESAERHAQRHAEAASDDDSDGTGDDDDSGSLL